MFLSTGETQWLSLYLPSASLQPYYGWNYQELANDHGTWLYGGIFGMAYSSASPGWKLFFGTLLPLKTNVPPVYRKYPAVSRQHQNNNKDGQKASHPDSCPHRALGHFTQRLLQNLGRKCLEPPSQWHQKQEWLTCPRRKSPIVDKLICAQFIMLNWSPLFRILPTYLSGWTILNYQWSFPNYKNGNVVQFNPDDFYLSFRTWLSYTLIRTPSLASLI